MRIEKIEAADVVDSKDSVIAAIHVPTAAVADDLRYAAMQRAILHDKLLAQLSSPER